MKTIHLSIIIILTISAALTSNVFAQNSTNFTMPHNAIRTPDGGWITPIQTTDQNGKNLTIHYETGVPVSGYANPGPPPDPVFLTDSKGNIDNFLTNHQILIRADAWPESPSIRTMDIGINVTSDTGFAFDDKKHLVFGSDVNHMQQIIWKFIPTKAGNYTVEKFSNGIHTSSTFFSVFDSKSSPKSPVLVSPLRQFKWGILQENIQCQTNLILMFKTEDGSPACVKPQTAQKLVERGWGMLISSVAQQNVPILLDSIKVANTNFTINYNITGGGNKLLDANQEVKTKSLVLSLGTINDGTLIVGIPRALIDAKLDNNQDEKFFVLLGGQEVAYTEAKTDTKRTLTIPFKHDSTKIEIIGSQPL